MRRFRQQEWDEIKAEVKEALRKAHRWKSTVIDKVSIFWLNTFDSTYENCFNRVITNPKKNPQWFAQRITYLLSKCNEMHILYKRTSILYKILTSIIT